MNFKEYLSLDEASKQFIVTPQKPMGGYTENQKNEIETFKTLNKALKFMLSHKRSHFMLSINTGETVSDEQLRDGFMSMDINYLGEFVRLSEDEMNIYNTRNGTSVILDAKIKRQLNAGKRFTE